MRRLDAVEVAWRGEIRYSIPGDVWSETLGKIRHGDLLSDQGRIVKRNRELLAAFGGSTTVLPDAGLDAVQVAPEGEILFSIRSNVVVNSAWMLSRGDILSDRGNVFRRNRELLANLQPAVTNHDYGLDALHAFPSGEIWFSVEEGFNDQRLGEVCAGDLLSSLGHRVFSNAQLLAAFAPSDPSPDYGLDALFVITDTTAAWPPPRIVKLLPDRASGRMQIQWDGEGSVFQLLRARSLAGPWTECSPIQPDLSFDDPFDPANGNFYSYRLQQW